MGNGDNDGIIRFHCALIVMASVRITSQLCELQSTGLATVLFTGDLHCCVRVRGAKDSPYELGTFFVELSFQDDFPYTPPDVRFRTPILHMNVSEGGNFCHRAVCKDWSVEKRLLTLIEDILAAMRQPDLGSASSTREQLLHLFQSNLSAYCATVMSHTVQHSLCDFN